MMMLTADIEFLDGRKITKEFGSFDELSAYHDQNIGKIKRVTAKGVLQDDRERDSERPV